MIAPDGSEIRLLANAAGASVCHCTLLPGGVSKPIAHRSVEEVWFGLEGRGEVWRSHAGREQIVEIVAGVSLNIPVGASFQFRNTGETPLRFLIATVPPWPGPDEALARKGRWR